MNRDVVLQTLRSHERTLQGLGVRRAAVFGSVARGEQTAESDVDLLVEIDPEARIGVFEYAGIVDYLTTLFPGRVDVANGAKLKPLVCTIAERDAVYAF
jgi:predicted nucleotidyltransferase